MKSLCIQESDSDEEVEEQAWSDEKEVDSDEDEWSTENLTIEEEPLPKHIRHTKFSLHHWFEQTRWQKV